MFRTARPGRRQSPRVAVIAAAANAVAVADICSLTYCQLQDVHPKTLGHNVVAGLVVATLPPGPPEPAASEKPRRCGACTPQGDGPVGGSPSREMKDPLRPCTM